MDYVQLGQKIKRARKNMCMTQQSLAQSIHRSYSFVGHIERGTRKCSIDTLQAIAVALHCSTDSLLFENTPTSFVYDNAKRILQIAISLVENPPPEK